MPTIDVPWGPDGSLELSLPTSGPFSGAEIDVAWPDTSGPLADYESALEQALDHPVDGIRLEDQVAPGSSVAIVVDDPSRWTPVREALPIILKRLQQRGRSQSRTSRSAWVSGGTCPSMPTRCGGGLARRSRRDTAASAHRSTTSQPTTTWARRRRGFRCGFFGRWREPVFGSWLARCCRICRRVSAAVTS